MQLQTEAININSMHEQQGSAVKATGKRIGAMAAKGERPLY